MRTRRDTVDVVRRRLLGPVGFSIANPQARSRSSRLATLGCVLASIATTASIARVCRADDVPSTFAPPPPAPYKGGPAVEGSLGMYAPAGHLKRLSSPGEWMRLGLGYEFGKFIAVFGSFDAAFLSTDRAPSPPGPRGFLVWGFMGGARLTIPLTPRVRIPLRAEIGAHKVDDQGTLETYGFRNERSLGFSWAITTGFEWRARSRHFGIALEAGIRSDASAKWAERPDQPFAILGALYLRYTL